MVFEGRRRVDNQRGRRNAMMTMEQATRKRRERGYDSYGVRERREGMNVIERKFRVDEFESRYQDTHRIGKRSLIERESDLHPSQSQISSPSNCFLPLSLTRSHSTLSTSLISNERDPIPIHDNTIQRKIQGGRAKRKREEGEGAQGERKSPS